MSLPSAVDVLERALALLESPLPHAWATCPFDLGPYCVHCAGATATTELSRGLALGTLDWQLETARDALTRVVGEEPEVLTLDEARHAVLAAILMQKAGVH